MLSEQELLEMERPVSARHAPERSDKLPDDALFDFDPDFMDGMP